MKNKHRIRVLVVAPAFKTRGGIAAVIKEHRKAAFWENYNCLWVASYIDAGFWKKLGYLFCGLFIYLINIWKTDLVHVHLSLINSSRRKALFIYIAYFLNKKIVIHFHASPQTSLDSAKSIQSYPEFYRNLFLMADRVIVLSESSKKDLFQYTGLQENVNVIYNPCPVIQSKNTIEKEKYILVSGTVSKLKGYEVMIAGFAQIAGKFPDWKLIFVGNGEIGHAKQVAIQNSIEDKVEFLGWVSGEQKDRVFRKASLLCLASYTEGMPMAILDAWAYGLPVVASRVGGVVDMIVENENGLTFACGDIIELAAKLDFILEHPNIREKIGEAAYHLAMTKYSLHEIGYQIQTIYEELTEK